MEQIVRCGKLMVLRMDRADFCDLMGVKRVLVRLITERNVLVTNAPFRNMNIGVQHTV